MIDVEAGVYQRYVDLRREVRSLAQAGRRDVAYRAALLALHDLHHDIFYRPQPAAGVTPTVSVVHPTEAWGAAEVKHLDTLHAAGSRNGSQDHA